MKVTLREKKLKGNKKSLFLDYYHKGNRKAEYLGIYLTGDRTQDKKLKELANSIRAKRELEIKNNEYGFDIEFKKESDFVKYFEKVKNKKTGNQGMWRSSLYHLNNYRKEKKLTFNDITVAWLEDYKSYLLAEMSPNTARNYFASINTALNQALKEGIIDINPFVKVGNIKGRETIRNFLTIEELEILNNTACSSKETKRAFLFSCYTGLRLGDLRALQWKDIKNNTIEKVQHKTKEPVYIPLSKIALSLLPEKREPEDFVFNIPSDTHLSIIMQTWIAQSEIPKKITFHCARHTFATLSLTNDVDIYTVSKLLGHKRLETTQVYAKVINKKKIEAVNKLPEIEVKL